MITSIIEKSCSAGGTVLAACLHYPWGYDDGMVHYKETKIDSGGLSMRRNQELEWCIGNYGLLFREGSLDEQGSILTDIYGVSLFKMVGGGMRFFYGNCQLAPSAVWTDVFNCMPKSNNPYHWVDTTGKTILHFERIASPVREAAREKYYRQPTLFRWVCNKDWLTEALKRKNLRLRSISSTIDFPNYCFEESIISYR